MPQFILTLVSHSAGCNWLGNYLNSYTRMNNYKVNREEIGNFLNNLLNQELENNKEQQNKGAANRTNSKYLNSNISVIYVNKKCCN